MNVLILSAGTRVKIVDYFKREIGGLGKVIVGDCDPLAPALYVGDESYIIPPMNSLEYYQSIFDICTKENIDCVFSLIDPEQLVLAKIKDKLLENNVVVIGSDLRAATICLNKKMMYNFLVSNDLPTLKSYFSIEKTSIALKNGEIDFPLFAKPVLGSGSHLIKKIDNYKELEEVFLLEERMMVQEYFSGTEYGVDCYIDIHNGKLSDLFIKKKIKMKSGETDKSVSVCDSQIVDVVKNFLNKMSGISGVIDIDVFKKGDHLYISEVNPRFGGGYPHAYECGVNFPKDIIKNLKGQSLPQFKTFSYDSEIYMMKYSEVLVKKKDELL